MEETLLAPALQPTSTLQADLKGATLWNTGNREGVPLRTARSTAEVARQCLGTLLILITYPDLESWTITLKSKTKGSRAETGSCPDALPARSRKIPCRFRLPHRLHTPQECVSSCASLKCLFKNSVGRLAPRIPSLLWRLKLLVDNQLGRLPPVRITPCASAATPDLQMSGKSFLLTCLIVLGPVRSALDCCTARRSVLSTSLPRKNEGCRQPRGSAARGRLENASGRSGVPAGVADEVSGTSWLQGQQLSSKLLIAKEPNL